MTRYAVHNLQARPIDEDEALNYTVAPDGPRYHSEPISTGTGPAIFDTFEEAEERRGKWVAELKEPA